MRRASPPANAPARGDFQSSAKRRSAVAPHELSTAVRIQRLAASVLAIRARAGTARGSFVSPSEKAAWNRTRGSGSPAIASATLPQLRRRVEPSLREQERLGPHLRDAVGHAQEQVLLAESIEPLERPDRIDAGLGQGALRLSRSNSRNGPTADRSCRSKISLCAVSRYQASTRLRHATSSAVEARLSRGGGE